MPKKGKEAKEVEVILESPPPPMISSSLNVPNHRPMTPSKEKTMTRAPLVKPTNEVPERKAVYKAKQEAAAIVSNLGTPQRRPSLFGRKIGETFGSNIATADDVVLAGQSVPKAIKCNQSTVSELSNPLFGRGRHRSISDDSAMKLQKALSKVKSNVSPDSPTGKSVKEVVQTLLKVTDKLKSKTDRETILMALNHLGNGNTDEASASQADSVSSHSHSRLDCDETDVDLDENDDASTFAQWEVMGDLTARRILSMLGLSYFWKGPSTVDEESEEDDDFSSSSSSVGSTDGSTDATNKTDETPMSSMPNSTSRTTRRKLRHDELSENLIIDDADMLRDLEELDHKTKLEAERNLRKKIEAERARRGKQQMMVEEKCLQVKNQKDSTLKARLERRRKRKIMITEKKAREEEARRQLKILEKEKFQTEVKEEHKRKLKILEKERMQTEAEEERKRIAIKIADEFMLRQEQAAVEARKKKSIRLEQIKEAARRREAEEQWQKVQQQKAQEKKRRADDAQNRLLRAKNDEARRQYHDKRRQTTKSNVTTVSDCSDDSDSNLFPHPLKPDRLSKAFTASFDLVRESGTCSSGKNSSLPDTRSTSPFWGEALSLDSLDSSQFDIPPATKNGKESRRGTRDKGLSRYM